MPDTEKPSLHPLGSGLANRMTARLSVVVLMGVILVFFQSVLVPVVLAMMLAFLLMPMVQKLHDKGINYGVAILFAEIVATLPVLGLIFIFFTTAGPLSAEIPKYQEQLVGQVNSVMDNALAQLGNDEQRKSVRRAIGQDLLPKVLDEGADFVQRSFGTATTILGSYLLTLLLSAFMLNEGARFREKFSEAFGDKNPLLGALEGIGRDVRRYVVAKTFISALTGFCVWIFLELCGVDFAAFWGLLAFPLNFIPTVGAVVASLPPILVTVVDPEISGLATAGVVVGLLAINGFIGAYLDPRYVGHAVKVSPLVVFISMLGWGLIWGPVGMILAVPIMVSVKVVCARIPALEPLATMLKG
jgi:predicted PurR-regulated permease PerM